jgi:hypothetical protein
MTYEVWRNDVWRMTYDVWRNDVLTYDVWRMTYDVWRMTYDVMTYWRTSFSVQCCCCHSVVAVLFRLGNSVHCCTKYCKNRDRCPVFCHIVLPLCDRSPIHQSPESRTCHLFVSFLFIYFLFFSSRLVLRFVSCILRFVVINYSIILRYWRYWLGIWFLVCCLCMAFGIVALWHCYIVALLTCGIRGIVWHRVASCGIVWHRVLKAFWDVTGPYQGLSSL